MKAPDFLTCIKEDLKVTMNLQTSLLKKQGKSDIESYFEQKTRTDVHAHKGDSETTTITTRIFQQIQSYWEDGAIPHTLTASNVRYGVFTAEAFLEIFNDPDEDLYRISVSQPTPDHLKISIPVHFRLSNISAGIAITPQSPMGVLARISLEAPAIRIGSFITAPFSIAVVKLERLDGGIATGSWLIGAPYGREGVNYRLNKQGGALFGLDLEAILVFHLVSFGRELAANIGDIRTSIPTDTKKNTFGFRHVSPFF
jgi:hypothetical protein